MQRERLRFLFVNVSLSERKRVTGQRIGPRDFIRKSTPNDEKRRRVFEGYSPRCSLLQCPKLDRFIVDVLFYTHWCVLGIGVMSGERLYTYT